MEELIKPCPFCGGWFYLKNSYDDIRNVTCSRIICGNCGAQGKEEITDGYHPKYTKKLLKTEIRAIRAWNTRKEIS